MRFFKSFSLFLVLAFVSFYFYSTTATAGVSTSALSGYNAMPSVIIGKPYQYINMAGIPPASSGEGALLAKGFVKLYTADANSLANSHTIEVLFTDINGASECNNYDIDITAYPLGANEDFTGAYGGVVGIPTGGTRLQKITFGPDGSEIDLCNVSGKTASKKIDVSSAFDFTKPSSRSEHMGLYTAVLGFYLRAPAITRAKSPDRAASYFNINMGTGTTNNVRAGFLAGQDLAIYPHPSPPVATPPYSPYILEWPFGTTCNVNQVTGATYPLKWQEDDLGTPLQPNGSMSIQLIKNTGGTESEVANLINTPTIGIYKTFVNNSWDPLSKYTLRFSGVNGNNGISSNLPFDSGDYYFACSQPFNTDGTVDISNNPGSDDENPTSVHLSGTISNAGGLGSTDAPVKNVKLEVVRKRRGGNPNGEVVHTEDYSSDGLKWVGSAIQKEYDYDLGPGGARANGWQVGDEVCARLTWVYKEGWVVAGDETTVAPTDPLVPGGQAEKCMTITNQPYVSVYGNDVSAGGGFTPCGANNNAEIDTYTKRGGSGTQLAAFALGNIRGFKSVFLRPVGMSPSEPKGLSFGNTNGVYGGIYGVVECTKNYYNDVAFPAGSDKRNPSVSTGVIPLNTTTFIKDGKQTFASSPSGTIRLVNGGDFNKKATLFVDGDVIIGTDITYADTSSWATISAIPYFSLVVKGDIYINSGVTQMDGLYIAQPKDDGTGGNIYTCTNNKTIYNKGRTDNFTNCSNQLVVNGAFIAKRVHFLRSYKSISDGQANESATNSNAAELFRFSPEMYIVQPVFKPSSTTESGEYDYITTLPPIL